MEAEKLIRMRKLELMYERSGKREVDCLSCVLNPSYKFWVFSKSLLLMAGKARKSKKKSNRIVLIKKANDLIESRYKFDIWVTEK